MQVASPAHWPSVKTALIKSIRTRVFFDRKYWARHAKSGDILKPVYFSSEITDDKAHQLNKRKSEFSRQFAEMLRIAGGKIPQASRGCRLRSRGRSLQRQEGTLKAEEEEETLAVLITGSFAAYESFHTFFFEKMTGCSAGSPSSFAVVRTRSHSLP